MTPRTFIQDRSVRGLYRRHPQLIAYAMLALVTVLGFWRITGLQTQAKNLSQQRADIACQVINENKDLVKDFTDVLISVSQANPPPNQTAEEKQRQQVALEQFVALLRPKLAHLDCVQFVQRPDRFLHTKGSIP